MVWHYFSLDHARAATTLSRKCGEIEALAPSPGEAKTLPIGTKTDHRSYATSSVLASVAFLEACINEFIAEASEGAEPRTGLQPVERQRITDAGEELRRLSKTLDRYERVLQLLKRQPFDRGARPFSDAALLVKLRNALVHYTPQWRPEKSNERRSATEQNFVIGLMDRRFSPNPFHAGYDDPYFPEKCLGHGCTTWAWRSALKFADAFFDRVGTTWVYENSRDHLQP
jgi:hypothetical protein